MNSRRTIQFIQPYLFALALWLIDINNGQTIFRDTAPSMFFFAFQQEGVEPRSIYQFHYTGWPDHGVPDDPSSVLNILEDVNIKQDHIEGAGPIVVHCR